MIEKYEVLADIGAIILFALALFSLLDILLNFKNKDQKREQIKNIVIVVYSILCMIFSIISLIAINIWD